MLNSNTPMRSINPAEQVRIAAEMQQDALNRLVRFVRLPKYGRVSVGGAYKQEALRYQRLALVELKVLQAALLK